MSKQRMQLPPNALRMFLFHKMPDADALSELIDNAFGPAAGNATTCVIEFDRKSVTVSDDGKGVRDLNALLTPGESKSIDDPDDIGSYGVGGKLGMFHFGTVVSVATLRDSRVHHHTVDYGRAVETNEFPYLYDELGVPVSSALQSIHGTKIEISSLHKGRQTQSYEFLCDILAHRYLLARRQGRKIIVRWPAHERELNGDDIISLFEADVREFNGEINGKPFTVIAGDTKNYNPNLNGLWFGYGFRFICREKKLEGKGLPSRFYGRVVLGREWKKSLSPDKTDIVIDKGELCAKIYDLLKDWIELLRTYSEEIRTDAINTVLSPAFEDIIRLTGAGDKYSKTGNLGRGKGKRIHPHPHSVPVDPTAAERGGSDPQGDRDGRPMKKKVSGIKFNCVPLGTATACRVIADNGGLLCELNSDLLPVAHAWDAPFKLNVIWPIISTTVASLCRTENEWARKLFPSIFEQVDVNSPAGLQDLYDRISAYLIAAQPDAKSTVEDIERKAA